MSEPEKISDAPAGAKVIKRYANRKLYDTVESRYVTLEEIAGMIKDGVEVKIVDNRSKEDLTSVTLAQIIFEEEKKKNQMPLGLLKEIIRRPSESLSGFFQKEVSPRVASLKEEAELKLEDWQRRIDERVRQAVENVLGNLPALGKDLQSVVQRLQALEKALDELEAKKPAD